jgi:hypothetical protein
MSGSARSAHQGSEGGCTQSFERGAPQWGTLASYRNWHSMEPSLMDYDTRSEHIPWWPMFAAAGILSTVLAVTAWTFL